MAEKLKVVRLFKDLDFDFTRNPVTNDVSKKTDLNAVKQALKTLIYTNFYERPFAPEKAGNLRGYLFDIISPVNSAKIRQALIYLIENYEPRVEVVDIYINENNDPPIPGVKVKPKLDENELSIRLTYNVINFEQPQTLIATLKRVR